jgi:hypothetical protein
VDVRHESRHWRRHRARSRCIICEFARGNARDHNGRTDHVGGALLTSRTFGHYGPFVMEPLWGITHIDAGGLRAVLGMSETVWAPEARAFGVTCPVIAQGPIAFNMRLLGLFD